MVRSLCSELRAELTLATATTHKQDHAAGDPQGERVAVVFLNHRQGEVRACRNSGAGPYVSILGEYPITIDRDIWITLSQRICQLPVSGRTPSI